MSEAGSISVQQTKQNETTRHQTDTVETREHDTKRSKLFVRSPYCHRES